MDVKTVADLGAGTGFYSKEWTKLFPGSRVIALDISEFMITYMKENLTGEYSALEPVLMQPGSIPLENDSVDVFISINLHHELDDHMDVLRGCYRCLCPGGKMLISDWKKIEAGFGPPMDIRVEPLDVETQLLAAGFCDVKINHTFEHNYLISAMKEY